ncbi:host attachment protein [Chelativorans xinjiangense]|uniref:host attachment protein n=1 Tax=Chelativorans xinjiangense TaxID=2681485 RepID=UPI00135B541D|nr:host attachment protein [Chelativorans xinjiangense]
MRKPKTWILVADGAQARIVRELTRDPETGERLEDIVHRMQHKPLRQIMSDRPGRAFASHGARRSAMQYHADPVRERQRQFAAMLIDELEKHHAAGALERLVVIAEPRMLGLIREALPPALKPLVVEEFGKDLIKLPTEKLYAAIADLGVNGLHAER